MTYSPLSVKETKMTHNTYRLFALMSIILILQSVRNEFCNFAEQQQLLKEKTVTPTQTAARARPAELIYISLLLPHDFVGQGTGFIFS